MPHAEHGFTTAILGLISGFVISALISSLFSSMGAGGTNLAFLANLFSTFFAVLHLERAKYWGLSYIFGYFAGLILFGQYLMEGWELTINFGILNFYILQKIIRKSRY